MSAVLDNKKVKAQKVGAVTAKLTMNIGSKIDRMHELREKKRALEAQVAEVEGEFKGIEEELLLELESQGIDASRGTKASASITKNVAANITDFDAVCKYVKKTGYFHLFQRRISDTAYRELLEKGTKQVPGLEPFVKKRLNLRSL